MAKKVLVISTSPRLNSNSDQLAQEFAKGAREAGHEVEEIRLRDKEIAFCKGCLACLKTGTCVIKDDAVEIAKKMGEAEVIAFATPVYYFGMCGQMKTMLDRANPLYCADYQFRDIYLLASAAEEEESAVNGTREGVEYWISCFEKARFAGCVFAAGVAEPGAIKGSDVLGEAFAMGKSV